MQASSQCFSLQKSEIARKLLSFFHFSHGFCSLHGSDLTYFWKIVSTKMAATHIFQSDVRNWPASVSRREIEVFNPQAWDSRLRRESWQVYEMLSLVNRNEQAGSERSVSQATSETTILLVKGRPLRSERVEKTIFSLKPVTPNSDLIDFTLSNARQFYLSKGDPLGVKGLSVIFLCHLQTKH